MGERSFAMRAPLSRITSRLGCAVLVLAAVGCSSTGNSDELAGADEEFVATESQLTGDRAVGSTLETTADLNLRSGAGTNFDILTTMPKGSKVSVVKAAAENGFYQVKYTNLTGWASGQYLVEGG